MLARQRRAVVERCLAWARNVDDGDCQTALLQAGPLGQLAVLRINHLRSQATEEQHRAGGPPAGEDDKAALVSQPGAFGPPAEEPWSLLDTYDVGVALSRITWNSAPVSSHRADVV
jgi:hypothetical protein